MQRTWVALLALLLATTGCARGLATEAGDPAVAAPAAGSQLTGEGDVHIIVVSHGQASDPFWSVVKNGVDRAAETLDARVQYQAPETFDMVQMSQIVRGAIAQRPDGLAVSIPDADALSGPIREAVRAGIPVISMNSGDDIALELGVLAHVGQSERQAGFGGGQRLAELGVRNALCINHEQGNVSLEIRCQGFAQAIEEAGGQVRQLAVDGNDPTDAKQRVQATLSQDPSIDGGLAVGPLGMGPTLAALRETGRVQDTHWGSFDLGTEILQAVQRGDLEFAIDQQQFLQGYLAVEGLVTNARLGVHPVGIVQTGPAFVTQEQAERVMQLVQQGLR